jgi:hypothetical protein
VWCGDSARNEWNAEDCWKDGASDEYKQNRRDIAKRFDLSLGLCLYHEDEVMNEQGSSSEEDEPEQEGYLEQVDEPTKDAEMPDDPNRRDCNYCCEPTKTATHMCVRCGETGFFCDSHIREASDVYPPGTDCGAQRRMMDLAKSLGLVLGLCYAHGVDVDEERKAGRICYACSRAIPAPRAFMTCKVCKQPFCAFCSPNAIRHCVRDPQCYPGYSYARRNHMVCAPCHGAALAAADAKRAAEAAAVSAPSVEPIVIDS